MHKSLDSSFSRRRPSPEQTFCCWLAECVHKNSTAHTACVSRRWRERESDPSCTLDYTLSLSHIENASAAAAAMGFMSILRTHAVVALNILCATAHQDFSLNSIPSTILVFPFFSRILHPSFSIAVCIRAPVDFSLRLPHEKSNVSRAICARFLLPVSCSHTRISSISSFHVCF
jgi:hypothetical protein